MPNLKTTNGKTTIYLSGKENWNEALLSNYQYLLVNLIKEIMM